MRITYLVVTAVLGAACTVTPSPPPSASSATSPSPGISAVSSPVVSEPPAPQATSTPAAGPLTPAEVEAALRTIDGTFVLVAAHDARENTGAFPQLTFHAQSSASGSDVAQLWAILIYPTTQQREAMQPAFEPMVINGPDHWITWDGMVHSEWVGVENVLVEVVLPGGSFGGRSPTPSEGLLPAVVRNALLAADASP